MANNNNNNNNNKILDVVDVFLTNTSQNENRICSKKETNKHNLLQSNEFNKTKNVTKIKIEQHNTSPRLLKIKTIMR